MTIITILQTPRVLVQLLFLVYLFHFRGNQFRSQFRSQFHSQLRVEPSPRNGFRSRSHNRSHNRCRNRCRNLCHRAKGVRYLSPYHNLSRSQCRNQFPSPFRNLLRNSFHVSWKRN
jgi:hypothetical protein